jgi:hypothetical protein
MAMALHAAALHAAKKRIIKVSYKQLQTLVLKYCTTLQR